MAASGKLVDSRTPRSDLWTNLRDKQLFDPETSVEEKAILQSCSAGDLIDEIKCMERRHADESKTRRLLSILQPYLQAAKKVGPAMDVLSSADPHGIASLVWGSVRLMLVVRGPCLTCARPGLTERVGFRGSLPVL